MSKLFIGCRVKFINGNLFKEYNDREGYIVGRAEQGVDVESICDWLVVFDGETSPPRKMVGDRWRVLWPNSSSLVPITPEGHQPVSWEECLWSPYIVGETV